MEKMIEEYMKKYPESTLQDILKLLYQCEFGSNHMIHDLDQCYKYLKDECSHLLNTHYEIEEIGEDYVRFHLFNANEIELKTINQLFVLSSKSHPDLNQFIYKLNQLKELYPHFASGIESYIQEGCPSLRHSQHYRDIYNPHYRIIKKGLVSYYPLLLQINKATMQNNDLIIGIDGMCGSGKSTLASLLCSLYDAQLFCMDDFFLQKYQRSEERYSIPGENIDHERFLKEVLIPLKNKQNVLYKRFNCQVMEIEEVGEIKEYKPISIIEGTYCMHPKLRDYIDYSVVLKIDEEKRLERLKQRNTPNVYQMFVDKWIPLETLYFDYYHIDDICDLLIKEHSCY